MKEKLQAVQFPPEEKGLIPGMLVRLHAFQGLTDYC